MALLAATFFGLSPAFASIPQTPPDEVESTDAVQGSTSTTSSTSLTISASTTSSTHPDEFTYYFRIGAYPRTPLKTLRLRVGWGSLVDYMDCGPVAVAAGQEATVSFGQDVRTEEVTFGFGNGGLQQSQRLLSCDTSMWHADAWWEPTVEILEALDIDGQPVDLSGMICIDCARSRPVGYGGTPPTSDYDACGSNICGDVVIDGVLNSSDALALLKRAVGVDPKYIQRYDVNRSGKITALDSLSVLRRAVDLPASLYCEAPPAADCSFGYPIVSTTQAPVP